VTADRRHILSGHAAVPAVAHEVMLCWYLDL